MNGSTAQAITIIDELVRCGVRDFVLSPGSRSAPLALELAKREKAGSIELHVRIDERSAGFFALGLAKFALTPSVVITTSGSAVANLAPAIVEASYAGIPLIALTADRPTELRNTGGNQTIDQVGFFGSMVRFACDIPAATVDPDEMTQQTERAHWVRKISSAVRSASNPDQLGPVHINVAFREPLVPDSATTWSDSAAAELPTIESTAEPLAEPIDYVFADAGFAALPSKTIVVAGDIPNQAHARAVVALAESCGWPIVSEPSSNTTGSANSIGHGSLVAESLLDRIDVDCVVTVGRFGLTRSVMKLVDKSANHIAVRVGGKDNPDPLRSATIVIDAVPLPPRDNPAIAWTGTDDQWLELWKATEAEIHGETKSWFPPDSLTSATVAECVWRTAKPSELLLAAASRPVRDLEAFAHRRDDPPVVFGNRGASGIDGLVSTAAGIATSSRQHVIAMVGDLAFLHDVNGMLVPALERRAHVTVVVVDNDGGGIFSGLEQGAPQFAEYFERVFGTAHGLDLERIARSFGVPTVGVTTCSDLVAAIANARVDKQMSVIVAQTISREDEQDLRASFKSRLHSH